MLKIQVLMTKSFQFLNLLMNKKEKPKKLLLKVIKLRHQMNGPLPLKMTKSKQHKIKLIFQMLKKMPLLLLKKIKKQLMTELKKRKPALKPIKHN